MVGLYGSTFIEIFVVCFERSMCFEAECSRSSKVDHFYRPTNRKHIMKLTVSDRLCSLSLGPIFLSRFRYCRFSTENMQPPHPHEIWGLPIWYGQWPRRNTSLIPEPRSERRSWADYPCRPNYFRRLYDHSRNTSKLQTDRRTEIRTDNISIAIPRFALGLYVHRAVK